MQRTRENFILAARRKFSEVHARAVKDGLWDNKTQPELTFNCRGRAAGRAWIQARSIELNIELAVSSAEAWDHILEHTIAHEYAHLTSFRLHGRDIKPHGREWASHCRLLGIQAQRCHDLDVSTVSRVKTFKYDCPCGTPHAVTVVRHNRMVKGKANYLCSRCKGRLVLNKGGA